MVQSTVFRLTQKLCFIHFLSMNPQQTQSDAIVAGVSGTNTGKKSPVYLLVAACFVDIRDFTQFANNRDAGLVEEVLSCLFKALSKALDCARKNIQDGSPFQKKIEQFASPTLLKQLGDGAMLVW